MAEAKRIAKLLEEARARYTDKEFSEYVRGGNDMRASGQGVLGL